MYYSNGVTIDSMGAKRSPPRLQTMIESKVRKDAQDLEKAPYGYRPYVGYQASRLIPAVPGRQYGAAQHAYPKNTPCAPASQERFTKE